MLGLHKPKQGYKFISSVSFNVIQKKKIHKINEMTDPETYPEEKKNPFTKMFRIFKLHTLHCNLHAAGQRLLYLIYNFIFAS